MTPCFDNKRDICNQIQRITIITVFLGGTNSLEKFPDFKSSFLRNFPPYCIKQKLLIMC